MDSGGADVIVNDGLSSGKVGEGDNLSFALSLREEQAVRRKMNITARNFFKFTPPTESVMKNPCTERPATNGSCQLQ
jgi:hypothetical protein